MLGINVAAVYFGLSSGPFAGGLITSLGPCSLSLLPVTLAYLAGFDDAAERPWQRSLSFCGGIVASLVLLGLGFVSVTLFAPKGIGGLFDLVAHRTPEDGPP